MLWYLLAVAVVVLALAVLAAVGLSVWRAVRQLMATAGRAGDVMTQAQREMGPVLDEMSARARPPAPVRAAPRAGDSAALAARVTRSRTAR